ncbi:uncharacterized protein EV420DRAFT_1640830 [Desarmillaria tabescens]|uniref:Mid2 domain-containing protein n=1 Tax=Armillaria tabescens TaxID=1929756 RepID=A0AA39N977_ARMTA|nr:uncharacterized protein EV420DRAFT_1640830 [Desarmillaria tabescens]KAK0461349.1 hypothetical protein EV420DRAFT_1640830 [Desarmillaria tabescens]
MMQAYFILCLVTVQAFASPFVARQNSNTSDSNDISVIGFTTTQVHPTSTTTVLSTKTEYTVVTPLSSGAIVTVEPYTTIVSGSITQTKSATLTLYPITVPSASASIAASSSSKRNGAIAGGVVGAVVVAAIAAIVFMRFRNKRSPRHWRNRRQWLNLDGGGGDVKRPPSPIIATVPSPTTAAPILVREKHRSLPSDPFSAGPSHGGSSDSVGAAKRQSATYIEMEAKPGSVSLSS